MVLSRCPASRTMAASHQQEIIGCASPVEQLPEPQHWRSHWHAVVALLSRDRAAPVGDLE